MNQIVNISLRNLARQRRRNVLLGTAIACGAMALVLANAYSHGISKVLFERIVRYTNGHVALSYMRNGEMLNQVFPDDRRIRAAVAQAAPNALRADEAIGVFGRAIGNGVADNVIMIGVDVGGTLTEQERREFQSNFKMISGTFLALNDKSHGTPVLLAQQKAKYLNVGMGDQLRVRFYQVTNQASSATLTVAGIFKPANAFMTSPIFVSVDDLRRLAGYRAHDIAGMQLTLRDPQRTAKLVADRLHDALKPGLAVIPGDLALRGRRAPAQALGFRSDSASLVTLRQRLPLGSGDSTALGYRGVVLAGPLAARLGARRGDTVELAWTARYDSVPGHVRLAVNGVAAAGAPLPAGALLVNERDFYKAYYGTLPDAPAPQLALPDSADPLWPVLAPEYVLMKRCATTDEYTEITREMGRATYKGIMVSVQSMYETASVIVQLERALNLITLSAVMVLFFIILVGVVNTLRMTIRERTREIGTVRAIGMQRGDVRNMFLLETSFLALIASAAGAAAAFLAMWGMSALTIDAGDNPLGMLLVDGHLYFAPTAAATLGYIALIVAIAAATAYFPARRAANLTAAAALRHYE
ncbi:MAG TPA: FtsX-like permease family protein [Candidatus Edwardsbacteria bacterium]|nr:FtsX-like permease family protein [Candidatus Edwardsbacteria bacterium]